MRRLTIAAVLAALCPTLAHADIAAVVRDRHAAGVFDGVVAVQRGRTPPIVATAGLADRATATPLTAESQFRLASLTKQVTAVLVMREVEAGRMDLAAPIGRYLPGLPEATGRPTLRQLLLHRSGLPNPSDGPDDVVPPYYLRTDAAAADMAANARGFCAGPVKGPPDAGFEYNNCDYILLGAALEAVTGRPYAQLIEALGAEIGADWRLADGRPVAADAVARGYEDDGNPEAFQNVATYGAAGALIGDAADALAWDRALLDNTLVTAVTARRMFTPEPNLRGQTVAASWAYDLKLTGRDVPVRVIERQGSIGGTRVLNLLVPAEDLALIVLSNTTKADLFNSWSGKGLGPDLLAAALASP